MQNRYPGTCTGCGCCGGSNDYMSAQDYHSGGYGDY